MSTIQPTFKLAGVMGWPIAHSRSPSIHNHWIQQHGLNGAYVLLPVNPANLQDALKGLSALGFAGCNLTIPHKVMALSLVDRIDATARRMGAINTIVVEADGSLSGYNNDGFGYIQSLRDAYPQWRADAGPVLVMGAGGAARAVIVSLAEQGAKDIRICNRTASSAHALATEFTTEFVIGSITASSFGVRHCVHTARNALAQSRQSTRQSYSGWIGHVVAPSQTGLQCLVWRDAGSDTSAASKSRSNAVNL